MKYLFSILSILLFLLTFSCKEEKPTEELPRIVSTGNPQIDGLTAKLAATPNDAKLYAARAAAYYEMEGYDEAIVDMAKALSIDSTNVEYHYLLSDVFLDYYRSQQALNVMERAVQLDPQNTTSLLKLAELQMVLKQNEGSIKTLAKVLKVNKNNARAYFFMGLNLEQVGEETRAINSFQTAIENDPGMADAHMKLGQIYANKKDDIAIRYFDNAVAAAPNNSMIRYAKAEYLHNTDQLDKALETLKNLIAKDQQFLDAYFRSGVIYLEKDSTQQAYNQFNLVVMNDPASPKGYYYRGFSAELNGDLTKAKADYEQALVFSPSYDKAKTALARLSK